jgi:hypothetical protein
MKKLEKDERGQLLDAICEYALNGIEPDNLSPIASMAFNFIGPGIERDYLTYETRAGQSRENGKLGGRPPKKIEEPSNPLGLTVNLENNPETLSVSDSDSDSDKKKRRKKKTSVFNPPILTEVVEFFLSKGSDEQTAKKAFDHYDIAGWKNKNGDPVINWKQTMLTNWINSTRSYTPKGKTILPDPYKQLER